MRIVLQIAFSFPCILFHATGDLLTEFLNYIELKCEKLKINFNIFMWDIFENIEMKMRKFIKSKKVFAFPSLTHFYGNQIKVFSHCLNVSGKRWKKS